MKRLVAGQIGLTIAFVVLAAADEPAAAPQNKPQWQRMLQGDDEKKALDLQKRIASAEQADDYDEAIQLHGELLALRTATQGADHWETVNEKWELDAAGKIAALSTERRAGWRMALVDYHEALQLEAKGLYAKALPLIEEYSRCCEEIFGAKHHHTTVGYSQVAYNLYCQGKYGEAQPLFEKALEFDRELLGEMHFDTAANYDNLALTLAAQGMHAAAQPLFKKALDGRRELLGDKHLYSAATYYRLAMNLNAQKKYAEAQPLYETALGIYRALLGEMHPYVAASYKALALNLNAQRKYSEAQPLFEAALHADHQLLGEKHRDTAETYANLGLSLYEQGKYAAAQPLYEKVLDLRRELLGEKDPLTAQCYNNLAHNLHRQGKYSAAQPLYEEALSLRRELLGERDANTAQSYYSLAVNLNVQRKYPEAQPLYEKALNLRRELLGEKHPDTAVTYNDLATNLDAQGKYAEAEPFYEEALGLRRELMGERDANTAQSYFSLAVNLNVQRKYPEAQPLYEKALNLRRELLGEKHPDTAVTYNDLATNLDAQGKYADAHVMYQEALDIRRELFGEKHPDTAASYHGLASSLGAQGKYAAAQALHQKALDVRRELLGDKHLDTVVSYISLGNNLCRQYKFAAAQPLLEKGLELCRELYGEEKRDTAGAYNALALNLRAQGKYADALPFQKRALEIVRQLLGEKHPDTATAYHNLGQSLDEQGKHADAFELLHIALALRRGVLGEMHPETVSTQAALAVNLDHQRRHAEAQLLNKQVLDFRLEFLGQKHPETLNTYNNLAHNLHHQGKYAEAQSLLQKALDINREIVGEKHVQTALAYNSVAVNLMAQGKYATVQKLLEHALILRRELLGDRHPDTTQSYDNLALNLHAQGKYAEASVQLRAAAASYEASRLSMAARGFDRAAFGAIYSPYGLLAATQARLVAPVKAWLAAEAELARGLLDEAASRHGATLSDDERTRQATLNARLTELQVLVLQLISKQSPTDAEKAELGKLQNERRTLEDELAELAAKVSRREIAALAEVQAATPTDTALIMWIDYEFFGVHEHWGFVVRSTGDPQWERLRGTRGETTWTSDDGDMPRKLSAAAAGNGSTVEVADAAQTLYAQRIAPLEKHLDGVKRLLVVPVNAMAGVPVEILTDKYNVSYVPSGTFLAKRKQRPAPSGDSLLALGDPVFPPAQRQEETPSPDGGLLVLQVLPGGSAVQAGFMPDDVVLKYAGHEVASVEQLSKLIEQHGQDKTVAVLAWRAGKTNVREVPPGKLRVVIDRTPAPQAIAAKRVADKMLLAIARGGDWKELPGTAVEVARLAKLVPEGEAVTLTRSAASEQELEQLRASGKLAEFRYLHFATHGAANNERSFESALILSQDNISQDIPLGGGKYYDGRLTANEVLETWKLDNVELVTLSACESALGAQGGGDGLLGFAQAFLLAGARSVCLSLWKVDDTATALLMDRFYQNLLAKREGLSQPMGKAEALAEAKQWLRNLSRDEAANLAADISHGVGRGNNEPALKLVVPEAEPQPPSAADDRPFAHPRYWAAFILIGDPD